jgi:hypothetical protein
MSQGRPSDRVSAEFGRRLGPVLFLTGASLACGSTAPAAGTAEDAGREASRPFDAGFKDVWPSDSGRSDSGAPDASRAEAGAVVKLPLSGCYDAHTVSVSLGGAETFALNVDTGSSTLGVAAEDCASCAEAGVTPLYAPGKGAVDLHESVKTLYDTGELGWSGEGYRDTVTIGGFGAPVQFAAIASQKSYFFPGECDTPSGSVDAPYQGIVGFGPDALLVPGTTGYFDQVVKAGLLPDVFAIELCHVGGSLWLGGYEPAMITGPVQYTPMTPPTTSDLYSLDWSAFAVGTGAALPLPVDAAGTVVDSGGQGMFVPDATFQAMAAALNADPEIQATLGPAWFSPTAQPFANCVTLDQSPSELDALFPPMTLTLGAASPIQVALTATESYLTYSYVSGSMVQYCQGVVNGTTSYGNIFYLGQSLMMNRVLIYDRAGKRFGIAPGTPCAN